jgi:hypothetical protein
MLQRSSPHTCDISTPNHGVQPQRLRERSILSIPLSPVHPRASNEVDMQII